MTLKQLLNKYENLNFKEIRLNAMYRGQRCIINMERFIRALKGYIDDVDDIQAIIIFGSAVHYPGYEVEYYYKKKYIFFGDAVKKKRIKYKDVGDVDFLIITNKKYFDITYIKTKTNEYWDGSCVTSKLVSCGIDLMNRSISQVKDGINNGDSIALSAIRNGVVLCDNGILKEFGIKNESNLYFKEVIDGLNYGLVLDSSG
jgi:hypothetical protein